MLINLSLCPALLLAYPHFFIGSCLPDGWSTAVWTRFVGPSRRTSSRQNVYEDDPATTALLPTAGSSKSNWIVGDEDNPRPVSVQQVSRVDAYWLWIAHQTQRPTFSFAVIAIVTIIVGILGAHAFNPKLSATTDAYLPRGSSVAKAIDTMTTSFNPGSTYPYQILIDVGDSYGSAGALNISFMVSACKMLQRLTNASAIDPVFPPGTTIVTYFFAPPINLTKVSRYLNVTLPPIDDCEALAYFVALPNISYLPEGQIRADKLLIDKMVSELVSASALVYEQVKCVHFDFGVCV